MGRPRGIRNRVKDGDGEFGTHSDKVLRNTADGTELRSYIERIEGMNAQIKEWADARKDIFKEFKSNGYDTKTLRAIIKRRAMDPNERDTADALLDMYMAALGDFASSPLGRAGADVLRQAQEREEMHTE